MRKKSHKCEKCGHNFSFAWNLKQHLKHNRNCGSLEEQFKCANCGKNFTLSATLKNHFARCIAVDPYRFACSHCPRKFTFKSSLRKHTRERCPNINYESNEKPTDESIDDFIEYEELEEVHIDDIVVTESHVKIEIVKDNIEREETPPDFDDGDVKYLMIEKYIDNNEETGMETTSNFDDGEVDFSIIENDLDIKEETHLETKFIYDDSCSDIIEFEKI